VRSHLFARFRGPRMKIYVYRTGDFTYHATMNREVAHARGEVVEAWSADTKEALEYLRTEGTHFTGVYDQVKKLAEHAELYLDRGIDPGDLVSEHREAVLAQLCGLPFTGRLRACWALIRRKLR